VDAWEGLTPGNLILPVVSGGRWSWLKYTNWGLLSDPLFDIESKLRRMQVITMKKLRLSVVFCLAAFLLAACGASEGEAPGSSGASPVGMADFAPGDGYANAGALVDTEWMLANLREPDVRLIDVSSRREVYVEGHLPGAQFIQWNTELVNPDDPVEGRILGREALSRLLSRLGVANDDKVVVYDNANNLFAARAYWVLKYYRHAYLQWRTQEVGRSRRRTYDGDRTGVARSLRSR